MKVTGVAGIPSDATAVVLNVTAVNATQGTFVTVWPHGGTAPTVSNLNVVGPQPKPNLVGRACRRPGQGRLPQRLGERRPHRRRVGLLRAGGGVEVLARVTVPRLRHPHRALGICSGVTSPEVAKKTLVGGNAGILTVKVTALGGVPSDATAVVLNVTAVDATRARS